MTTGKDKEKQLVDFEEQLTKLKEAGLSEDQLKVALSCFYEVEDIGCEGCPLHEDYDEYEQQDLRRQAMKLRQMEDLFNAIFGFYIPFIWGSYMPSRDIHDKKIRAAMKAVRAIDEQENQSTENN